MPDIEDQIQQAIREGKFSDLPGKGKPLRLDDDTLAAPEWRLAFHLLRENGFSLPWLELRHEIESELASCRQAVQNAWEWRAAGLGQNQPSEVLEAEWQRAVQAFRARIESLNGRIFDYNLQTPADRFQMRTLNPEKELERVRAGKKH